VGVSYERGTPVGRQAEEPLLRASSTAREVNLSERERKFFIGHLLVRIHFIIVMIRWTGLAPLEFEFSFPGSLTFTSPRDLIETNLHVCQQVMKYPIRWSATRSSKVNLPHAINLSASCDANLVT